jgi:UDP:flavonoid glycosyltransferase YjiC (YdhE family)
VVIRALFHTWDWPSHLRPMLPLARALHEAGHRVMFAVPPGIAPIVREAGFAQVTLSGHRPVRPTFRQVASGTSGTPSKGPRVLELFAGLAEDMAGDLVDVAREFVPDLVLYDPTALAGPIAAAVTGASAVRIRYGLDLLKAAGPAMRHRIEPLAGRFSCSDVDPAADRAVDPWPGTVAEEDLPVGPGPVEAATPAPGRPRVCVTWGHTMARLNPSLFLAGAIAAELADSGMAVTLAVSAAQTALLGRLPGTVRVLVDQPVTSALDACSALVSQGGAGTLLAGLARGVPQLAVGQLPDHLAHARAVAEIGAGRVLLPGPDTAAAVRDDLRRLLGDPAHRAAAQAVRTRLLSRPSPSAVAARLSTLVRSR